MPAPAHERLLEIYRCLLDSYGPQHWWPDDDDPFVVVVGAILTQSAAWKNVEAALARLREADLLSTDALLEASDEELERAVRPSGYFRMKARKLKAFAMMLAERFDGRLEGLFALPVEEMRAALLATYGIGPETADDIVLYGARKPAFVVDAYTRRIFDRLGIRPASDTYDAWRCLFVDSLPQDTALFNEYHALIVRHAKVVCRKERLCPGCPLLGVCPAGQPRLAEAEAGLARDTMRAKTFE
jgi:endonuclease-3 related protein